MTDNDRLRGAVVEPIAPRNLANSHPVLLWYRSSVSLPMSRLELDLLGHPYARGYGAALSGFTNDKTKVLIRQHQGHLYSATTTTFDRTCTELHGPAPFDPTMDQWHGVVRSQVEAHICEFAHLTSQQPEAALRRAAELFEKCIMMHHQLLLPARQMIERFLADSTSDYFSKEAGQEPLPFATLASVGITEAYSEVLS